VQSLVVSPMPAATAWAGAINRNAADAATFAKELDDLGPANVQALVDCRQQYGPFRAPNDRFKVQGIGQWVLEANRGDIRLDRGASPATAAAPQRSARR